MHQAVLGRSPVEVRGHHAGLDDGHPVDRGDLADAPQRRGHHDEAAGDGGGSAGEAGARPPGNDRDLVSRGPDQGLGDVVGAAGHDDRARLVAGDDGGLVLAIAGQQVGIGQQAGSAAEERPELGDGDVGGAHG